jgi:hypothetical protein
MIGISSPQKNPISGATVVQAAVAMWIDGELFVLQTASDDGQKPTWPAPYVK